MTLDEEKQMIERKKQVKRSNDRLMMLESMEKQRQEKMEKEIEFLHQQRLRKENELQQKRELAKQKKESNNRYREKLSQERINDPASPSS